MRCAEEACGIPVARRGCVASGDYSVFPVFKIVSLSNDLLMKRCGVLLVNAGLYFAGLDLAGLSSISGPLRMLVRVVPSQSLVSPVRV